MGKVRAKVVKDELVRTIMYSLLCLILFYLVTLFNHDEY